MITLWIEIPRGSLEQATVRDPSLIGEIGRVSGGEWDEDGARIRVELGEDALRARLAETRRPF